jgi:hypothetical protein
MFETQTSPHSLSLWVGTFNLANAAPDAAFSDRFLAEARDCDLVVLGCQEAHFRVPSQSGARLLGDANDVSGYVSGH